jgi:RNA polymerase sigma-70 factor (ECF subfamily)
MMNPPIKLQRKYDDGAWESEGAELLSRIAGQRDEAAFSRLYDLSAPLLYGLACRMLGPGADAEDVLQEVMLQAWNRAAAFDPGKGTARVWLVVLARSRCLDKLRRRGTRRGHEVAGLDGVSEPADGEATASETLEQAEVRTAVRKALAALPEEQRRTLETAYFEGLSQSEIAARTGEPLGTVKTRMRLGMLKLMELLQSFQRS